MELLQKYWTRGTLNKRYFNGKEYFQPFSARDRLQAGTRFYDDFIRWQRGHLGAVNYQTPRVDGGYKHGDFALGSAAERFRTAVKHISPMSVQVVYKIVVEEAEIKAPSGLSAREKLYFNDEIKGLLCRGLDDLCVFYSGK